LGSVNLGSTPTKIAISQSAKKAYVTTEEGPLEVVNLANNLVAATIPGDFSGKPAIDESANKIYALNRLDDSVYAINGANNTVAAKVQLNSPPASVAVDPATKKVYVALPEENAVAVIDAATNKVIKMISVSESPEQLALNPVTHMVYVTSQNPNASSMSNETIFTTIDGMTDSVFNQQLVPGTAWGNSNGGDEIAVNEKDNLVTLAGSSTSYGCLGDITYLFDGSGNLIKSVNAASDQVLGLNTGSAVDQNTGNTFLSTDWGGLKLFNKDGAEMQVFPSACAKGVGVLS
jgi:YVTN family beta-propeller protein